MKPKNKILIIDDEIYFLKVVEMAFKKNGYDVWTASNPTEALKIALKEKPDLIMSDYMLPEKNGLDFCLQIRNLPELKNCIFIIMTNKMITKEIEQEFHNLPDGWVSKTIGVKEMMVKIEQWLNIFKGGQKKLKNF